MGKLTIQNGRDLDAVAVLTSINKPQTPLIAVYIRAEDSFTITKIKDGAYLLYFALGKDWDKNLKRFTRKVSYFRFKHPLDFKSVKEDRGIRYTEYTATLHPVVGGTAETEKVRQSEFPDITP